MKKVLFIACFTVNCCFAQTEKKVLFTPESFIQLVRQYHPVVKQANIQVQKAEADILSSKGGFDPTIEVNAENKTFDGKNYYFHTNPEIKIPTPIGLDVKAGLEENGGQFLSSESSAGRSSYAGIDVALAKGMLMDKRRAALQQSKIFGKQSEQERLKIVNDILFDAYVSYWQWAGAYQLYNIYSKYFQIANDRLRLTRIAYTNGDRALIDTIEAYTQVQNFDLLQTDALIKLNTAKFDISNFLWLQNDSAYLLPQQFVPDTIQFQMTQTVASLEQLITLSNANNPSLRSYDFKLQALEVERKLKFQNLLPVLNLKYNLLNKDYYVFKGLNNSLLENNYKWGIDFKLPIFIREGRGEYRKAKLKIAETNLELNSTLWEIENKIKNYYTETNLLQQQITTAKKAYGNFDALLKIETLRFANGESSLFLVNSRENKLIEILQKQVELTIKYFKAKYAIDWASGSLR